MPTINTKSIKTKEKKKRATGMDIDVTVRPSHMIYFTTEYSFYYRTHNAHNQNKGDEKEGDGDIDAAVRPPQLPYVYVYIYTCI